MNNNLLEGLKEFLQEGEEERRRAAFHEAGHLEYGLRIKPEMGFIVKMKGGGNASVRFDDNDFATLTIENKYAIAVAG